MEPPHPRVTPACHQRSQPKPSSCSSRRNNAVATNLADAGNCIRHRRRCASPSPCRRSPSPCRRSPPPVYAVVRCQ
ncbi:unnamed protein product [Brassica rapa]|uniref:Uncharacterized protein n=1 Tax=Brassica campestris TaxID=3711 RepID=A0A3P5YG74_BRACM|nr:unnamed protein product [Brassica rapa]VDC60343.1 unnamed protein product [Brassica rapa]